MIKKAHRTVATRSKSMSRAVILRTGFCFRRMLTSRLLAWRTYSRRLFSPRGRVLLLPCVFALMNTNDEQGGPAWTTPPSTIWRVCFRARRKPGLSRMLSRSMHACQHDPQDTQSECRLRAGHRTHVTSRAVCGKVECLPQLCTVCQALSP